MTTMFREGPADGKMGEVLLWDLWAASLYINQLITSRHDRQEKRGVLREPEWGRAHMATRGHCGCPRDAILLHTPLNKKELTKLLRFIFLHLTRIKCVLYLRYP